MATDCNASTPAKNWGWKNFPNNVLWLSQQCSRPLVSIKTANRSLVQHMGNGNRLQRQHFCQKFGVEKLSKQCPMTFLTMFQASSVYKSCKWKLSAAYGNYSGSGRVGSGRLTCDYNAISVQLQLQLPTGTELGKILSIKILKVKKMLSPNKIWVKKRLSKIKVQKK